MVYDRSANGVPPGCSSGTVALSRASLEKMVQLCLSERRSIDPAELSRDIEVLPFSGRPRGFKREDLVCRRREVLANRN